MGDLAMFTDGKANSRESKGWLSQIERGGKRTAAHPKGGSTILSEEERQRAAHPKGGSAIFTEEQSEQQGVQRAAQPYCARGKANSSAAKRGLSHIH
jgi:hypothetical protein